ncbi:hypothetical protein NX774_13030 [Massilia agilis]|uniref:Uncharacterized protein n=1 Tax=Massilia agilis TaxID=1811226 RepID=A0ABT2DCF5_9BURK|nr:hypothetical protein [Massilia agilis]MCS0808847.1 hypothetical protein [Massilia agilis]
MRHQFTPAQVTMLICRAERQLEQVVADTLKIQPAGTNIARSTRFAFDETVVSLMKLFREHIDGGSGVATQIAREYAMGFDPGSGTTTIACVRKIADLVRHARERHLAA